MKLKTIRQCVTPMKWAKAFKSGLPDKPIFAFHAIHHLAFLCRILDFTHNLNKNRSRRREPTVFISPSLRLRLVSGLMKTLYHSFSSFFKENGSYHFTTQKNYQEKLKKMLTTLSCFDIIIRRDNSNALDMIYASVLE